MSILEEIDTNDDNENATLFSLKENKSRFANLAKQPYQEYLEQYDALPRSYINAMHFDTENRDFDNNYVVTLDTTTEKLMIGDSRMDIDGPDIIIKNKRYRGTLGLHELLFKKNPLNFTLDDENNYKLL